MGILSKTPSTGGRRLTDVLGVEQAKQRAGVRVKAVRFAVPPPLDDEPFAKNHWASIREPGTGRCRVGTPLGSEAVCGHVVVVVVHQVVARPAGARVSLPRA